MEWQILVIKSYSLFVLDGMIKILIRLEDFIGICNAGNIKADTVVTVTKYVWLG